MSRNSEQLGRMLETLWEESASRGREDLVRERKIQTNNLARNGMLSSGPGMVRLRELEGRAIESLVDETLSQFLERLSERDIALDHEDGAGLGAMLAERIDTEIDAAKDEMTAVVRKHVSDGPILEHMYGKLDALAARLKQSVQRRLELETGFLAMHESHDVDSVTGLRTRKEFENALAGRTEAASRSSRPLSLLMVDIDRFKRVNDEHGHQQGDEVLGEVGLILREIADGKGSAHRYGGEELAIILPNLSLDEALAVARRVRVAIDERAFARIGGGHPLHTTVSVGVSSYPQPASSAAELVATADKALYRAKRTGRNRVCAAFEGPEGDDAKGESPDLEAEFLEHSVFYRQADDSLFLVPHVRIINRTDSDTTITTFGLQACIGGEWKSARGPMGNPGTMREGTHNVNVREQEWLEPHQAPRVQGKGVRTLRAGFVLDGAGNLEGDRVAVSLRIEDINGIEAPCEGEVLWARA